MWNLIKKVQSKIAQTNTAWSAHALGKRGFQYMFQGSSDPVAMQKALETFEEARRMFRSIERDDLAHTLTSNIVSARWTLRYIFKADTQVDPNSELLDSLSYLSQKKDSQQYLWALETVHVCVSMDMDLYQRDQVKDVCEWTYDAVRKVGFLSSKHRSQAIGYLIQIIYMYNFDRYFSNIQSLYDEMLNYFESVKDRDKLLQFKMFIAFAIVDRVRHGDNILFEKAVATLQELASDPMIAGDDRMLCRILFGLGKGYRNRTLGNQKNNAEIALASFKSAELLTARATDPDHWLKCKFMLVDSFIEYKSFVRHGQKIPLATGTLIEADAVSDSEELVSELTSSNDVATLNYAKILRFKIRALYLGESISGHLDEMASTVRLIDGAHRGDALCLYAGACIQTFVEQGRDPKHLTAATEALEQAIAADEADFRINNLCASIIMLANVRLLQKKWTQANEQFERVFCLIGDDIALGTPQLETRVAFGMTGPVFAYSCFAAAVSGDISAALTRYETLNARGIQEALGSRTEGSEFGGLTLQKLEVLATQAADKKIGTERTAILDSLDTIRNQSSGHKQNEVRALSDMLAATDRWVLLPLFSLTHFCCVLIPPNSQLSDAIVSPIVDGGYLDLVGFLQKDDGTGFADAVNRIRIDSENPFEDLSRVIFDVPDFIDGLFGEWLGAELNKSGAEANAKIAIISSGILNQLPLTLAGYKTHTATALGQRHDVSIIPSLTVLSELVELQGKADLASPSLAVFSGSDGLDLKTSQIETKLIGQHFGRSSGSTIYHIATKQELTERLPQANYWHFISHGDFNFVDPMASYFKLADKTNFTLAETATLKVSETRVRLATLSTCFLGQDDFADPYRDFASFPNAFMQMGVLGVIAAIWAVSEQATTLLMARFYEEHLSKGRPPAGALRNAQLWLSEATTADLIAFVREQVTPPVSDQGTQELLRELAACHSDERPFRHPVFWAGFAHYGV